MVFDPRFTSSNATGEIIKWYGTCPDIEDQKQTQAVLRESEERLMLVEATNLGIWDWNLITGVIHLSNRFKTIFGLPPEAADYKERTNF